MNVRAPTDLLAEGEAVRWSRTPLGALHAPRPRYGLLAGLIWSRCWRLVVAAALAVVVVTL